MSQDANSSKTAKLNDQFRQSFTGGKILITQGIHHLPEDIQAKIFQKVRTFNSFTEDNDPYSEHDFGSLKMGTKQIFWKIDYYDLTMQYHSSDPADPALTTRTLTIMMDFEY